MSIRTENRRSLYKRQIPLTQPHIPKPYTTLNQPANERLRLAPANFSINPLAPQGAGQSRVAASLVNQGLSSIADQVNSTVNQARLAQNVAEAAEAAQSTAQLRKALADMRLSETSDIDRKITEELAKQGITKQMLQKNPNLRRSVTAWKAKMVADLNAGLDASEAKAIGESQASLSASQSKSRASLEAGIASYEAGVASDVANQQAQIMKDAGFSGAWGQFQQYSKLQQDTIDSLLSSGTIAKSGEGYTIAKSVGNLSDTDIELLNRVGVTVTGQQRDNARNIASLAADGVIKVDNDTATVIKPTHLLSDAEIKQLNAVGISVTTKQRDEAKTVETLKNNGVIKVDDDKASVIKPTHLLSDYEIKQLNSVGINVTAAQRDEAKTVETLRANGVIKVDADKVTLAKTLDSLSNSDISLLNSLGLDVTTKQRDEAVTIKTLTGTGVVTVANDKVTLAKSIGSLSDNDLQLLNNIGISVSAQQRDEAKTLDSLVADGTVKIVGNKSNASATPNTAALNTRLDNKVMLDKPLKDLSDYDLAKLKSIGINVSKDQRDLAVNVHTLSVNGIVKVDGDNVVLSKSLANLSDSEVKQLNNIGLAVTSDQRDTAKSIQSLTDNGVVQQSGDSLTLSKALTSLSASEVSQLRSIGFDISQADVDNAKAIADVSGSTNYTPAQIAAQNVKFKEALDKGIITASEYNLAIAKQNANLSADQTVINRLVSSGVVKQSGGSLSLTKSLASLSDSEIKQLNTVGFNISSQQVQQSRTQQEATTSLLSKGVISTTHNVDTPLQKSLVLNVSLAAVSDNDIKLLQAAGFSIPASALAERKTTLSLVDSGTVRLSGNQLELTKPVTTLSDKEIMQLKAIGVDVPNLPKGPEQYIIEYAQNLPTKLTPVISGDFGATFMAKRNLSNGAAILGDFLQTLAAPVQLVESIIPGVQPLEQGWRGPSSSTLKYYVNLTPAEQLGLTAGGTLASFTASYLEFMPVGFAVKAIPSVAKGLTSNLLKVLPVESGSVDALAASIRSVAGNLKIPVSQLKLPLTEVSTTQVTNAMAVLLKNPKFQQALVWGSMAGLNAVDIYGQLASGKSVESVIAQSSVSIAGQIGAIKGFTSGFNLGEKQLSNMAKLVRLTGGDIKLTPSGAIETPYLSMKDVPKQLRDIYALELDPLSGKVKVIGFLTKVNGKTTVQPIIREFEASTFNKLMQGGKIRYSESELRKLSMQQLFDKVVLGKNISASEVKTILVKYIGEDGYRQVELAALKNGGKEFLEMSPKEMKIALYKELGDGSLWKKPLGDFETTSAFKLSNKTQTEYIAAIGEAGGLKTPVELQMLYRELRGMGFDSDEASFWASQILSKSKEQIAGKMLAITEKGYDAEKLIQLSAKYGSEKGSVYAQILKSEGFTDKQVTEAIRVTALGVDNPEAFAKAVNGLNASGDQLAVLFKGVPSESLGLSLSYMNVKPIAAVLEASDGAFAGKLLGLIPAASLGRVVRDVSPKGLAKIAPYLSQENFTALVASSSVRVDAKSELLINANKEQLTSALPAISAATLAAVAINLDAKTVDLILPKLSAEQFSAVIPKLDNGVSGKINPEVLISLVPKLTPDQFNAILPKLTPEQFDAVLPKLSSDQFQAILTKLEITPETVLDYMQLPEGELPKGVPTPIPPAIFKKILEYQLKQNKKELAKQGVGSFSVRLQYNSTSESFTVKSNSFGGAAREALVRRKSQFVPVNVHVERVGK